ncbi:MAG: hypothetical protein RMK97_00640 [Sutterellaceae bacterium]|nr:hypothetical protein [Burkholderiaceae bacterium]MDW8429007.1 hypothetical protein [Sutterellaceae bacterium]
MQEQAAWKATLRWIAFVPAAVLAGLAARAVMVLMNRFVTDGDSVLELAFRELIGGVSMGATFVYVGALVAPAHRKAVAVGLASVGLLIMGFLLFPAVWTKHYLAMWGVATTSGGLLLGAYLSFQQLE